MRFKLSGLFTLLVGVIVCETSYLSAQVNAQIQLIHNFAGSDGLNPGSGLYELTNHDLIGATFANPAYPASGTLYTIKPDGSFEILVTFPEAPPIGYFAGSTPFQASDGFVYGTTCAGGDRGKGIVYQASLTGALQIIHNFQGPDGSCGIGLVEGLDGKLYGATIYDGPPTCRDHLCEQSGAVFRLAGDGSLFEIVAPFTLNYESFYQSQTPFALAPDGNFYGLAGICPTKAGINGCTYRIDRDGDLSIPTIYPSAPEYSSPLIMTSGEIFSSNSVSATQPTSTVQATSVAGSKPKIVYKFPIDGFQPSGGLIHGSDANLYLNGYDHNTSGDAAIQLNLVSQAAQYFPYTPDLGKDLVGEPLQASDGKLYFASSHGGSVDGGTVTMLDLALPAPKPEVFGFSPSSGAPGTKVTVWGKHFIGVTAVTLNGMPVTVVTNSPGLIAFVVPDNASSGTIAVNNAGGITQSRRIFSVN